ILYVVNNVVDCWRLRQARLITTAALIAVSTVTARGARLWRGLIIVTICVVILIVVFRGIFIGLLILGRSTIARGIIAPRWIPRACVGELIETVTNWHCLWEGLPFGIGKRCIQNLLPNLRWRSRAIHHAAPSIINR